MTFNVFHVFLSSRPGVQNSSQRPCCACACACGLCSLLPCSCRVPHCSLWTKYPSASTSHFSRSLTSLTSLTSLPPLSSPISQPDLSARRPVGLGAPRLCQGLGDTEYVVQRHGHGRMDKNTEFSFRDIVIQAESFLSFSVSCPEREEDANALH